MPADSGSLRHRHPGWSSAPHGRRGAASVRSPRLTSRASQRLQLLLGATGFGVAVVLTVLTRSSGLGSALVLLSGVYVLCVLGKAGVLVGARGLLLALVLSETCGPAILRALGIENPSTLDGTDPDLVTAFLLQASVAGIGILIWGLTIGWGGPRPVRRFWGGLNDRLNAMPTGALIILAILAAAASWGPLSARMEFAGGREEFLTGFMRTRYGYVPTDPLEKLVTLSLAFISNAAAPAVALLYLRTFRWPSGQGRLWHQLLTILLMVVVLGKELVSGYRSMILAYLIPFGFIHFGRRRLSEFQVLAGGAAFFLLGCLLSFGHLTLYELTAGYESPSTTKVLVNTLSGHKQLDTLARVIDRYELGEPPLNGEGALASLLAFVPRTLWSEKPTDDQYGTSLVQEWASLPTWYQLAPTATGEGIAHFGYLGFLLGVVPFLLAAFYDSSGAAGLQAHLVAISVCAVRVVADLGMGVSAWSISLFKLGVFVVILVSAQVIWSIQMPRRTSQRVRARRASRSPAPSG